MIERIIKMLPPHELKNKTFTRAMRGYNPVEVDEYIEFLIGKYTELYRENDELERKLKSTVAKLDEIKGEEDSIRSTLIDAKRAAVKIKSDAEERAEAIIRSAKASCNSILADFNEKIESGRETLISLKSDTLALKQELFERYSEHIKYIDTLTDNIDFSDIPDTDYIRRRAVTSLKNSIAETYAPNVESEPESEYESAAPDIMPEPDFEPEYSEPEASPEETITFTPASDIDNEPEAEPEVDAIPDEPEQDDSATVVFNRLPDEETDEEINKGALNIEREPLTKPSKGSITDSVKELNRRYKAEEVINTPDSDLDDANYLDFVKSVTGKNSRDSKKQADFDLLFSDDKKK